MAALLEIATLPSMIPALRRAARRRPSGAAAAGLHGRRVDARRAWYFLQTRGYDVQTWGSDATGLPRPPRPGARKQKIRYLHHRTGRKVSLVGWSLGGVFGLYAAHHASECVRCLITLGSPLSIDPEGSRSPAAVKALYRMIAHLLGPSAHTMQPRAKKMRERTPPPVPTSCLYSISDGVVPAQEATIAGDPKMHENIRVTGSHTGMGFNAMALFIVADRLAQPEGQWRPFAARRRGRSTGR